MLGAGMERNVEMTIAERRVIITEGDVDLAYPLHVVV
jgi:hypothetical protein